MTVVSLSARRWLRLLSHEVKGRLGKEGLLLEPMGLEIPSRKVLGFPLHKVNLSVFAWLPTRHSQAFHEEGDRKAKNGR
jgi:hypothetical protein